MLILVLFNILFFYGIYSNPFRLATSELLSTFFPTWIWQGRTWIKGKVPKYDSCFWINAHAHPVLSTYYPVSGLLSLLSNFVKLDTAFKIFVYSILGHYLFGSIGYYLLLKTYFNPYVALFGAITFYQAYHIKQQPCIVYTLAWFPWIAICAPLAIGMILLAGYYPLAIYLLPLGLLMNHDCSSWILGFAIGSIQLVPFLKYLPKTVRTKKQVIEDVPESELKFYFGLTPIILILLNPQWRYLWIAVPVIGSYLLRNHLPRIYQRAWLLSVYVAVGMTLPLIPQKVAILLLFLHALDLYIHNHNLLPTRPYTELYKKPSLAFNTSLTRFLDNNLGKDRVSGLPWPLFTGLINNFKTLGYSGGMQLKLMAKWRNDKDSNGSGEHDYFRSNIDDGRLSRFGCEFAFTSKKIDWLPTGIKYLYRNPRRS